MAQAQLTERFETALVLAHRLHRNQVRKAGGVPYIAHLLSVAALVLEDGGSEDEAIAALLHDAIEDQGGQATREEIGRQLGDRVVDIVDGCTASDTVPKPPWKERKLRYLETLQTAPAEVVRVSLADKLHNARSLLSEFRREGAAAWCHFNASPTEIVWFYEALLKVYQNTSSSRMVEDLQQAVVQLKTWVP